MKVKKVKTRPMIMLELILAVAIIGISSSLIIGVPSKVYQKELALLYELELQREAENFFAELLINFKDTYSFDSLTKERKTYEAKPTSIDLEDVAKADFTTSYKLWMRSFKESNNETFYKLVGCQLIFENKSFPAVKPKPIFFTLLTRLSPPRHRIKS